MSLYNALNWGGKNGTLWSQCSAFTFM
jgi:hypothetical protein